MKCLTTAHTRKKDAIFNQNLLLDVKATTCATNGAKATANDAIIVG